MQIAGIEIYLNQCCCFFTIKGSILNIDPNSHVLQVKGKYCTLHLLAPLIQGKTFKKHFAYFICALSQVMHAFIQNQNVR